MSTPTIRKVQTLTFSVPVGLGLLALACGSGTSQTAPVSEAQSTAAPSFKFDPDWPKPLPNKWKIGGVTGLAVDKDDNVWVLNRPNDLRDIEAARRARPADRRLLPPPAVDDSHRQERQRHRLVRRAAGARHGRRQPGVRLHRAEHRAQVRPEDRARWSRRSRACRRPTGAAATRRGAARVPVAAAWADQDFPPQGRGGGRRRVDAAARRRRCGVPREVSADDADDRGRHRGDPPRRARARDVRRPTTTWAGA